ncbi:hypothetical protein [Ruegeria jejuensis]
MRHGAEQILIIGKRAVDIINIDTDVAEAGDGEHGMNVPEQDTDASP